MGIAPRNGIGRRNVFLKRKPRCVNLRREDWEGTRPVKIRKDHFEREPGLPPLITLLRVFACYPSQWWTQGQVKKCLKKDWPLRALAIMWSGAVNSGCIRKARNPDFDSTKQAQRGNPIWYYKITQKGLWFVAMFE